VTERKRKASTSARGYGSGHRAMRRRWRRLLRRGALFVRAAAKNSPGSDWDLGHDDPHRVAVNVGAVGRHPEHRQCNRGTLTHRIRLRYREEVEVPPDDPANGVFWGPQRWSRMWAEWRLDA
jgi:hypothetical protein